MPPRLLHYSDVENAFDDPERIGRLAGLLAARDGDDALVVGSGDNTAPGVLSLVTEGRHSLPFFEAVDADFETFGNHDFDYGPDATRALVADSPQTWLTANVHEVAADADAGAGDDEATTPGDLAADGDVADAPRFAAEHTESWVVRDVDGTEVGLFGVTTPATNSINPAATDVGFSDPIAAGARAAEACRDAGAEYVVAVSHLGTADDELAVVADVDVVLGGHLHSEVFERVDDAVVLRPGVNGSVAYEVEFDDGDVEVTRHEPSEFDVHEGVADAMREQKRDANLDEVVAHVDEPIERTHTAAFRGESRIGNFVADAYRWATGADVGLQNSGGVREGDPLDGDVTVADVMSVVPFQEPVATAELTGAELRETVRQARGTNLAFGEPDWWHAHLSGASVVWDRDREEIVTLRVDGKPVQDDETYTLATTDYLFHTDHEFPALDEPHRVDVGDVQYEVLAAYARENGLDPQLEGRVAWSD